MSTAINTVVNKINKPKGQKLKILTLATHEGFQEYLAKTGHEFYMLQGPNLKKWDYHTRELPENCFVFNAPFPEFFPYDVSFDLILSQDPTSQLGLCLDIGRRLDLPVISLTHTQPPPRWSERAIRETHTLRANKHVYITEFSKKAWLAPEFDQVIRHGLDPEVFKGWHGSEKHGVSVVNQFPSRDVFCGWNLWQQIAAKIPMKLVGENPGLSESIKDPAELVKVLAASSFFVNTSQWSPIPLSLVEAMMVGMPIISTAKQEIPTYLKHEENALLAETPEEFIASANRLSKDKDLAKTLGANARQTALQYFSQDRFIEEWNDIFNSLG